MRRQLLKLTKRKSTRGERKFAELCKKLHIPFRTKVIIGGREIDFIIGRYAIEIDGHQQDSSKNIMLANKGYIPMHFNNWNINDSLVDWIKQICLIQEQDFQRQVFRV
jgi:very-short-patch-repair endonuclease